MECSDEKMACMALSRSHIRANGIVVSPFVAWTENATQKNNINGPISNFTSTFDLGLSFISRVLLTSTRSSRT
jgi:hypothetical protein